MGVLCPVLTPQLAGHKVPASPCASRAQWGRQNTGPVGRSVPLEGGRRQDTPIHHCALPSYFYWERQETKETQYRLLCARVQQPGDLMRTTAAACVQGNVRAPCRELPRTGPHPASGHRAPEGANELGSPRPPEPTPGVNPPGGHPGPAVAATSSRCGPLPFRTLVARAGGRQSRNRPVLPPLQGSSRQTSTLQRACGLGVPAWDKRLGLPDARDMHAFGPQPFASVPAGRSPRSCVSPRRCLPWHEGFSGGA